MHDTHVLQMNTAKGMLESTIAELKDQRLFQMKDKNAKTRQVVIARLEGILADLAEVVAMAGEISIEPIPFSRNTAWEVANGLIGMARGGAQGVEP
jgi:hypothetical protein